MSTKLNANPSCSTGVGAPIRCLRTARAQWVNQTALRGSAPRMDPLPPDDAHERTLLLWATGTYKRHLAR